MAPSSAFLGTMLQHFRNRLATCLLATVYLAAGAAGNLLHSHVHDHAHERVTDGRCLHAHGHDGHGDHDHSAPDAHGVAFVAGDAGDHHDDCTICRAAGQRVVPVQSVRFPEFFALVEPLRLAVTSEPVLVSARTHQSRAPPHAI